jgi:transcription termination/antitermination protein NusA
MALALSSNTAGNTEILQIADAVARDKGIGREQVIEALESAVQVAGRKKYGYENNIKAEIDRKNGEIRLFRIIEVVEVVENEHTQISLKDAHRKDKTLEIGSEIRDRLPPIDLGRISAQTAKQVIVQKVRDAERDKQFEEFKDKINEIISGTVKQIDYGNIVVEFGRTEAILRREELIPREVFRVGDRIRAYVYDVRREKSGPQIFLTRTRPEFMAKLFAQEVPEIYDGIIEIKAVSRDPGSRAKIAVHSKDSSINPVLSCVGVRGARVQAVVSELQGEKIDIIEWSSDAATFVVNALSSAEVSKVVLDEIKERIEVVVPDDQLSLAIGRRGQNVKLASQLVGWNIDILTEEVESNRRNEEFNSLSNIFTEALNVEEVIAQLLVTEGFTSIEEVAFVPLEDMIEIEGFDEELANELRNRARDYLENQEQVTTDRLREAGVDEKLIELGLSNEVLLALSEKSILTLDDFADLSHDEFIELVPNSNLSEAEINAMIMKAREHWFE